MKNTLNGKERFPAFLLTLKVGGALLLVVLVLGMFGQWALAFTLIGMAVFVSFAVLLFSPVRHMNRDSGSDDNHLPFTFSPVYRMLSSRVDPRSLRLEQELIERQQGDFKPFVFKDHSGE